MRDEKDRSPFPKTTQVILAFTSGHHVPIYAPFAKVNET